MSPSPKEPGRFMEVFHAAWSQAVMSVTNAEEEVRKVLGKVQGVGEERAAELSAYAKALTDRLTEQREELERRIDEATRNALGVLRLPRREQLAKLDARLHGLAQRVEQLRQ